jgi:hypothetical protein
MDISIFTDKSKIPAESDLKLALDEYFKTWMQIRGFVLDHYPAAVDDWNYPGLKYGWSFRMKDKKRAILYLLPRKGYFKVAFVFGQKAFLKIMQSPVSGKIRTELQAARPYAEGRGIRLDIREVEISDVFELIRIKLEQ